MKKRTDSSPETNPVDLNSGLPVENHEITPSKESEKDGLDALSFPIIGIGASAGGLDALEVFLQNVPAESGMAFVIIQHLDPTYKGMLVELLQKATDMPVVQVTDRLEIVPNSVYVIPPNNDLSILRGALYLFPPIAPRGLRLPIDFFFRALALDRQSNSIGVILSGMGSDGTLGLRAIKEKAGAVFVQLPETAQFDGMPRSAIDSGLADVVAPVDQLPGKILAYLKHIPNLSHSEYASEGKNQSSLEKIMIVLRTQTGHDFSMYKKSTIYRRIERRMGLHQIDRITNYLRLLQENHQETELLFKELLIGVTSFFRDPAAWEKLKNEILPSILGSYPQGGMLRAWAAGCSTGEEAYSLAIIFKETVEKMGVGINLSMQIFATDLDRDAIDKARQGYYPTNIIADVSPERLARFFVQDDNGYRVIKEIREMVVFAPQNMVMDAPFTRLDLLICRNLLIYLESDLQKKLMPLFHYCLNTNGYLFLGSAETIGSFHNLFNVADNKLRLYRRISTPHSAEPIDFPTAFFSAPPAGGQPREKLPTRTSTPTATLPMIMDQMLLKRYAPAAVMTNSEGDILYISGKTGKYLEPAVGKANLNIFAMAREGLQYGLNSAFQKAIREQAVTTIKNLTVGTNGGSQTIDLIIQPLTSAEGLPGMVLIVFNDIAPVLPVQKGRKASNNPNVEELKKQFEQEFLRLQIEMQSSRDQMQTSQEELKSTNEELQSTNEELQSTNEELTTSKEEMQSLNEELQTVNHELQARVEDLSRSNNDMKNLLDSTDIATLFLDNSLHVRRFTSQTSKLIRLIPGDAGRLVTDISSDLLYPELAEDVQHVLRTLAFKEKAIAAQNGKWFMVRIMPYRTLDNRIDGVVITFTDITLARKQEEVLRQNEQETHALFKYMPKGFGLFETIIDTDEQLADCRFIYVNDAFEKIFEVNSEAITGTQLADFWPGIPKIALKLIEQTVIYGNSTTLRLEHLTTQQTYKWTIFRPGESKTRFCMLLDDIEAGQKQG